MSVESIPAPARLNSLQALRGVAALMVVVFHGVEVWRDLSGVSGFSGPWDRGWAGVDLFFVLSGFVMVWVAVDRPLGVRSSGRFLFDRATRIYPLWWVFCSLMGLYFLVTYGVPVSPDGSESGASAWGAFARSMGLWPQETLPVLTVGWTLIYEMAFYVVFAALLWLPKGWRATVLILWGIAVILRWLTVPVDAAFPESWASLLMDPLCLEFLIGAAAAYAIRSGRVSLFLSRLCLLVGVIALAAGLVWAGPLDSLPGSRVWVFGIPSGLIVIGLVGWEGEGRLGLPSSLIRLGDASYTLYLSHLLVLLLLKRAALAVGIFETPTPLSLIGFAVTGIGLSVVVALILYPWLERPLLRLARRPLARSRQR